MVKNKLVYKKLDSSVENTKNNYASVAVLFFDEVEILFIKRSENMPTHKGHIAFPGGKSKKNIIHRINRGWKNINGTKCFYC